MTTGKFQFQLSNNQCDIHLIYQPSFQRTSQRTASNVPLEESKEKLDAASKLNTSPTICSSPEPITIDANQEESSFPVTVESIEQRWTGEQIGDFVRKLGFFHKEKDGGDEIKQFLHLNSVSIIYQPHVTISKLFFKMKEKVAISKLKKHRNKFKIVLKQQ